MDKTSVITNVEKNNNDVVIIKEGGSKEDTEPKDNGGSSTLTFGYTVQSGDNTFDLEYMGTDALDLNLGGIKAVDNTKDVILTLPVPKSSRWRKLSQLMLIIFFRGADKFVTVNHALR